jgi:uncharacterized membrane protein YwaF
MVFQMWSVLHLAYIASPVVLAILLYRWTKHNSMSANRTIGIVLSTLAVLVLVVRNADIWIRTGFSYEIIPLQICHFANFVLLGAFVFRNKALFALSFTLNMPAAYMSIIFANSLSNYSDFLRIRPQAYFWGHLLIVMIALWAVMVKQVRIDMKVLIKTFGLMVILFMSAVVINNLFTLFGMTPNYFYAMRPEKGTPLEWFYTVTDPIMIGRFLIHPVYWILTGLFAVIIVGVLAVVYQGIMFATRDADARLVPERS